MSMVAFSLEEHPIQTERNCLDGKNEGVVPRIWLRSNQSIESLTPNLMQNCISNPENVTFNSASLLLFQSNGLVQF